MYILTNDGSRTDRMPRGCVCALGFFDGVHKGHRGLIAEAAEYASAHGSEVAVWTLSGDDLILKPESKRLITDEERFDMLFELGVRYIAVSRFDSIRDLSGEEFVEKILSSELGASAAFCGFNYSFGKNVRWHADDLKRICSSFGIEAFAVAPVYYMDEPVSSSRIRECITGGEISLANGMLGYEYFYSSVVTGGKHLGKDLGFPTANIPVPEYMAVPRNGVYSSEVALPGGEVLPGVTNIGTCPTVTEENMNEAGFDPDEYGNISDRIVCETYIHGFSGDLYGKRIKVSLTDFIRDEIEFDDIEALEKRVAYDDELSVKIFEERRKA